MGFTDDGVYLSTEADVKKYIARLKLEQQWLAKQLAEDRKRFNTSLPSKEQIMEDVIATADPKYWLRRAGEEAHDEG